MMRWVCIFVASVAMAQSAPPAPASAPAHTPTAAELMRASLDKQREAVRKQAKDAGATLIPWSPGPFDAPSAEPAAPPACDAIANDVVTPFIESAAGSADGASK